MVKLIKESKESELIQDYIMTTLGDAFEDMITQEVWDENTSKLAEVVDFLAGLVAKSNQYESKIFRSFTSNDWMGLQGANRFSDGHDPLIAETDSATIIISPDEEDSREINVDVILGWYGEGDDFDSEYMKTTTSVKDAIALGEKIYNKVKDIPYTKEGVEEIASIVSREGFNKLF